MRFTESHFRACNEDVKEGADGRRGAVGCGERVGGGEGDGIGEGAEEEGARGEGREVEEVRVHVRVWGTGDGHHVPEKGGSVDLGEGRDW